MAKKQETKFVEKIKHDLRQLTGLWFIKTNERARRGTPDIICCYGGVFLAIEAKTNTGKLDRLQQITLNKIVKCGGIAFSTNPSSWPSHYKMICMLWHPENSGQPLLPPTDNSDA